MNSFIVNPLSMKGASRYPGLPGFVPGLQATIVLAVVPLSCFISSALYMYFAARLHSSSLPATCKPCPGGSSHQGTEGSEKKGGVAVQMGSDLAQVVRQKLTQPKRIALNCPLPPCARTDRKEFDYAVSQAVAL